MISNLVIHHANCPDGFGAAYMIRRLLNHIADTYDYEVDVTLRAMNHGDEPPVLDYVAKFDHVWLLDFANVPVEWLNDVVDTVEAVAILDHHQTALHLIQDGNLSPKYLTEMEWDDGLISEPFLFCLDQSLSGVGLAAMYCYAHGMNPYEFLPCWPELQDYDLWKFERRHTRPVFAAVTSYQYRTKDWDWIATMSVDELAAEGAAIERYRQQIIDMCARNTYELFLDGVQGAILCSSAPYVVGSDLAHALAERSDTKIGAYAIYHGNEVQIGLRSLDNGPDVAEIAEHYGGGGHKHASGLRMPSWLFEELTP